MNQFSFRKGKSTEISSWPQILEFSKVKTKSVKANSFLKDYNEGLRFVFILEGKHYWIINNQTFITFPNDLVIVFPDEIFGSPTANFEVGVFVSISLDSSFIGDSVSLLEGCSKIIDSEKKLISKTFTQKKQSVVSNFKQFGELMQKLEKEICSKEIGFKTTVDHILDDILILCARQLNINNNQSRVFPKNFQALDQMLRENLAHPWTVEEMASTLGLGTTTFNEKVKAFTGYPPLNYLINLRISEAIRLLKNSNKSLTDIAFDTGFYSSQHFSTTFKKLTGLTPSHFRKK